MSISSAWITLPPPRPSPFLSAFQTSHCTRLRGLPSYLILKLAGCGCPSYKDKKSYSSSTAKDWKTIWILFPSSATITQVQFAPFGYPYGNPGLSIVPFLPFKLPPHVWMKPARKGGEKTVLINNHNIAEIALNLPGAHTTKHLSTKWLEMFSFFFLSFFLTGRHRCSSKEKIHCMHPVNSPVQYFFSREQIVWKIHTALSWQGLREKSGNQLDLSRALGFFFSLCAFRHEEEKKKNKHAPTLL